MNTSGTATASNRFNETLTYDLRGNIGTLQRQGFIQSTCTFVQIDNLAYTYAAGTNRLISVADASGKTEGFKPGSGAGYTYDGNGNLKSDSYKSISSITYNHLNLPKLITFSSGNTIEIVYDASGNKLRKIVKQGATVQYEQDYSGGIEYRKTPAAGTFRIEAIYHEEGRYFNLNVDASNTPSWRKEYALRDHLGSTRLLFADKDGDGMVEVTSNASTNEILQELHYYPFGLSYGGSHWMNDAARDHKYLYNGKEIQDDWSLNLYAYGARYYDAALGRFTGVDPIADQFPHASEFNYAENEPVGNIDLHGLQKLSFKKLVEAGKNVATSGAVFITGMANAIGSDILLGVGRGNPQDFGDHADYAEAGQRAGDLVSVVIGTFEMGVSAAGLAGEGLLAPATGGATALAMAPTAAIGAHGFSTSQNALRNLMSKDDGKIYEVPGTGTSSGKPYVGRTKQASPEKRGKGANDGRDRSKATIIDTYDPSDSNLGAFKEQKAINERGGVQNLDNKRNERIPDKMKELEKKYGDGKNK